LWDINLSSILCPSCKAYLGLAAAGAADCPRCAAPLSIPSPAPSPGCPATAAAAETHPGRRDIVCGSLWLIIGIVVTAGTYLIAAEAGGGRYIVAWGAMLFGGLQFLRGLFAAARK